MATFIFCSSSILPDNKVERAIIQLGSFLIFGKTKPGKLGSSYDEFCSIMETGGFVRCGWDGLTNTELKIKEKTKATIRCIPFDEEPEGKYCIFSGKPAKHEVIFAKAY